MMTIIIIKLSKPGNHNDVPFLRYLKSGMQ